MTTLVSRYGTLTLAAGLSALMWATRGNHFISPLHLPDASWAIFFLLGLYVRQGIMLPLLLAQAAIADYVAITRFGASSFCVTPAYVFLAPAYSALWLSGRWCAKHLEFHAANLPWFALASLIGTFICELISSGSFYFLGGRFEDTSLREFGARLVQYFPGDLGGVALYVGCAALIHAALSGGRGRASHPAP